jgi:hypothetical protein
MNTKRLIILAIFILLVVITRQSLAQSNYFAGINAGAYNTTGNTNTFVGQWTGFSNIDGSSNAFFGTSTGYFNTVGNFNAFFGARAGFSNTTGWCNTLIGFSSGKNNTSGEHNTFLGNNAGNSNTSGSSNSFLGSNAGSSNTTGRNNLFLGLLAGKNNTGGDDNVAIGMEAGASNVVGNQNIFLGNYANVNPFFTNANNGPLTNAVSIGFHAQVTVNNGFVLGSINGVNGATADAMVGIGTTAPAYRLHLGNGEAAKPGSSVWKISSDRRLKKDISSFTDGLDAVRLIKPVRFSYNGLAGTPKDRQYVGIIAQEMQKIAPYTIGRFTHQDSTGQQTEYLDYDAGALTYILVNAIREVDDKYTRLLAEKAETIKNLESRISTLEQSVTKSPGAVSSEETGVAQLWQNEPNPTGAATVIRYRIPKTATSVQLKLLNLNGQELQQFDIREKGTGYQTINTGLLPPGIYVYHLLINGSSVAFKKLVIAN